MTVPAVEVGTWMDSSRSSGAHWWSDLDLPIVSLWASCNLTMEIKQPHEDIWRARCLAHAKHLVDAGSYYCLTICIEMSDFFHCR